MEVGDWITLGAVIVALGIGVTSILHTQSLQKRERKERLLNEIIEWALDITDSMLERNSDRVLTVNSVEYFYLHMLAHNVDKIANFVSMQFRGCYIEEISDIFGYNLRDSVEIVLTDLKEHIKLLNEHGNNIPHPPIDEKMQNRYNDSYKDVTNHGIKLKQSAIKVIEEATKFKTRDIS